MSVVEIVLSVLVGFVMGTIILVGFSILLVGCVMFWVSVFEDYIIDPIKSLLRNKK